MTVIVENNYIIYSLFEDALTATVGNITSDATSTYNGVINKSYIENDDLIIPQNITHNDKTYEITSIYQYAFYSVELSSLSLPLTIKEIGLSAFNVCYITEDITFLDSLEIISKLAFATNRFYELYICCERQTLNCPRYFFDLR